MFEKIQSTPLVIRKFSYLRAMFLTGLKGLTDVATQKKSMKDSIWFAWASFNKRQILTNEQHIQRMNARMPIELINESRCKITKLTSKQ